MSYEPKYCAPGDDQRPMWLLHFEDAERGLMVFTEEEAAREAWERHCGPSGNWNGRLFQAVERKSARRFPGFRELCRRTMLRHLRRGLATAERRLEIAEARGWTDVIDERRARIAWYRERIERRSRPPAAGGEE